MKYNKTKIEWCDYTWNPVYGCKHGCKYCYARRMNDRFHFVENWTEPEYPDLQKIPALPPKPRIRNSIAARISPSPLIFAGSMSDLFGDWVPERFIKQMIDLCSQSGNFMFLTKNPKRYKELAANTNIYAGTTVESCAQAHRIVELQEAVLPRKFVSIEPLHGSFKGVDFSGIDFVIVGAETGAGAKPPNLDFLRTINHDRIYYKTNLLKYTKW